VEADKETVTAMKIITPRLSIIFEEQNTSMRQEGFSFVELLMGISISLILLGAVVTTFTIQQKYYSQEQRTIDMQDSLRASMQMLVNDLLMAGYNPQGIEDVGIVSATATAIQFRADLNGDGDHLDPNEDVTYAFDAAEGQLTRKATASDTAELLADNIQDVSFVYYNADGDETTTVEEIRKIKIQITAQTENGEKTRTLTSDVIPRNLALNATAVTTTVTETTTTTTESSTTTTGGSSTTSDDSTTTTAVTTTTTEETTTTETTTTTTTESSTTSEQTTTTTEATPDRTGPTIDLIVQTPSGSTVPKNTEVEVRADITDASGIATATITTNEHGTISMTNIGGNTYAVTLSKKNNKTVNYYITAEDNVGNSSTSATYQYTQNG